MALTSSSTIQDAYAQYNNSLLWEDSHSLARDHIEACRWILGNRPRISAEAGITLNFESISKEIEEISSFLKGDQDRSSTFVKGNPIRP